MSFESNNPIDVMNQPYKLVLCNALNLVYYTQYPGAGRVAGEL
jgi:hypothetical protein